MRSDALILGTAEANPETVVPRSETRQRLDELERRLAHALLGGGQARIDRQHEKGKLTARERLDLLLDDGSFLEQGALRRAEIPEVGDGARPDQPGDGVVAGTGTVDDRPVAVYAQDFTVQGGSLGRAHADKICHVLDQAIEQRCPIVGINDSGGARIQEGVASLAGYGDIFSRNVQASGLVPQITIIAGPCAGGAVYSPALTDFVVMIDGTGHMFLTGPDVVETVTGEQVSFDDLGGAGVHGRKSGVAHLVAEDEHEAIDLATRLLDHLPRSAEHPLPITDGPESHPHEDPVLDGIVPSDPEEPYEVLEVIARIVDGGRFLEIMEGWAPQAKVGLARIGGIPVGIVANDPSHLAGVLDLEAATKMARFVRTCDSLGVPLVTLVDVPGFLPGTDQEWNGVIRHGAKLVYAYAEATVPTLTLVTGKAYGGAYIAMCSKHLGSDVNLAWPTARIAVMGPEGAVRILHRKEVAQAEDPEAAVQQLKARYTEAFETPYQAAGEGYIDAVIAPRETRPRLAAHLRRLIDKQRDPADRHGNIPL